MLEGGGRDGSTSIQDWVESDRVRTGVKVSRLSYVELSRVEDDRELLRLWKENGDQRAYSILYSRLWGLGEFFARRFADHYNYPYVDILMSEVCARAIRDSLDYFDFSVSNNKVSGWVGTLLEKRLLTFFTNSSEYKRFLATSSIQAVMPGTDSLTLEQVLPSTVLNPREMIEDAQTNTRMDVILNIANATQLSPLHRRRLTEVGLKGKSGSEVGDAEGVSRSAVLVMVARAKSTIASFVQRTADVGEDGEVDLVPPKLVWLKILFDSLEGGIGLDIDSHEAIKSLEAKLMACGILFLENGKIRVDSFQCDKFNTTFFNKADGKLVSGQEILRILNAGSFTEYVTARGGKEFLELSDDKAENVLQKGYKKHPALTSEDVVLAARKSENIENMIGHFDIQQKDGKWCVTARSRDFTQPFLLINGGFIGGRKIAELLGMPDYSISNIELFFKLVFGQVVFERAKQGPLSTKERCDSIGETRKEVNLERFREKGILVEKDDVIIMGKMGVILKMELQIEEDMVRMDAILKAWDCDRNLPGLKKFLAIVFPDKQISCYQTEDFEVLDEDVLTPIIEDLCSAENERVLTQAVEEDQDGRLDFSNTRYEDIRAVRVQVAGKSPTLKTVIKTLKLRENLYSIIFLYEQVFGQTNILPWVQGLSPHHKDSGHQSHVYSPVSDVQEI